MTESVGNNENLKNFGTYHCNLNAFPVASFDRVNSEFDVYHQRVIFVIT
jgi:hypothetical protein